MVRFLQHRRHHPPKNVIRKKLLIYFFITALLINSISFFTFNNTQVLIGRLNSIFINDIALTNLSKNVDSVESSLKSYLMTGHSEDLLNYLNSSDRLRNMAADFHISLSNNSSELLLVNITNMIETYLDDTDVASTYKRGTNIVGYTDYFNRASTVYGYINQYIDKLKIYQFQENNENYLELDSRLGSLQFFTVYIIMAAMLGNLVLIFLFAFSITEPIIKLSRSANEIAAGNYDIPEVRVPSNDEVKTLAVAFNRMTESIRKQLIEIREKAQIESQLKEQEMQNLKMKSILDETQLASLQAQIDPHYMFNTLNAGMQLAMFEGAEKTQDFMEILSKTMRYSLGSIKKPATLKQEIENIDNYLYLLKIRFGEKIRYVKEVDSGLQEVEMPRMILQPVVENAFTHGIGEMESGGMIRLCAADAGGYVRVEICDNGTGMNPETIRDIFSDESETTANDKQETPPNHYRIGLRNVIGRLMLYYHAADVGRILEIESQPGAGTTVILKLPYSGSEVHHV